MTVDVNVPTLGRSLFESYQEHNGVRLSTKLPGQLLASMSDLPVHRPRTWARHSLKRSSDQSRHWRMSHDLHNNRRMDSRTVVSTSTVRCRSETRDRQRGRSVMNIERINVTMHPTCSDYHNGEWDALISSYVDTWGKRLIHVKRLSGWEEWWLFDDEWTHAN